MTSKHKDYGKVLVVEFPFDHKCILIQKGDFTFTSPSGGRKFGHEDPVSPNHQGPEARWTCQLKRQLRRAKNTAQRWRNNKEDHPYYLVTIRRINKLKRLLAGGEK